MKIYAFNLGMPKWSILQKFILIMKLTAFILMMALAQVSAKSFSQTINLNERNSSIEKVLENIKAQSGFLFLYDYNDIKGAKTSVNIKNATIKEALDLCFKSLPLTYTIGETNTIVIRLKEPTFLDKARNTILNLINDITVRGRIVDQEGNPLSNANIQVRGHSQIYKSNGNGEFNIPNVEEGAVLVIRYVGYKPLEIPLKKATMPLNIKLEPETGELEEVTVSYSTGYQKIPKERATGSFDLISGKEIRNKIQTNVLERLEGMAPGLLLIGGKDSPNSDPAKDDGLTIRGVSTLYGTKRPLIVVDNFPIEGDINSINPNDVESITILKDAAAASIWGARAANGVIVITTKQGKKGDITFQYNNSFQFQAKPDISYLDRLSSANDIDVERKLMTPKYEANLLNTFSAFSKFGKLYMDSVAGRITPSAYLDAVNQLKGLDNTQQIKDLLMQSSFTQNHSFSFSGGNEKNQYYGSLNYTNSNGYNLKEKNDNYTVFLKSQHQVTDRLSFGVNANINFSNGQQAPVSALSIFKLKPYNMLQDANGNPLVLNRNADPANQNNSNEFTIAQRNAWGLGDESYYPLNEINNKELTNRNIAQRIQAELNYKIVEGVKLNLSYQLEKGSMANRAYVRESQADLVKEINDFITPTLNSNGQIATNPDGTLLTPTYNVPQGSKLSELRSDYTGHVIRGVVTVDKTIENDHQIAAQIGVENKQSTSSSNSQTKYGYDDLTLKFVNVDWQRLQSLPLSLKTVGGGFGGINDYFTYLEDRFVSAFGNASYTFKNKYVASGSIRIDQTNLFGTDPKYLYKPMWSAGVAWNATNEDFLSDHPILNTLQVRATYGINGNIPKNSGPFMIASAGINFVTNLPSNKITVPANNSLRWESTATTNFGLDFDLFGYRINGKLDYYQRNTTDILGDDEINPTYGFTNAQINSASMTNKGVEVQLTSKNIAGSDFRWSTTFMYAFNKNKITHSSLSPSFSNPRSIANGSPYLVGMPYGGLYSLRFAGLSPDKGQLRLLNADGGIEPNGVLTSRLDFAYYSGNKRPVHNGAFSNMFSYKGLDLSFMFVFYAGNVARQNTSLAALGSNSMDGRLADAWKNPGDENNTIIPNVINDASSSYARAYYANYLDANVFNASYAKLREVILTYNLSPKELRSIKYLKGLQFNLQCRNLLTITNNRFDIDPEAFSSQVRTLPTMPTYAFGINATF